MRGHERCDEILRLIDETLVEYERQQPPRPTDSMPSMGSVVFVVR